MSSKNIYTAEEVAIMLQEDTDGSSDEEEKDLFAISSSEDKDNNNKSKFDKTLINSVADSVDCAKIYHFEEEVTEGFDENMFEVSIGEVESCFDDILLDKLVEKVSIVILRIRRLFDIYLVRKTEMGQEMYSTCWHVARGRNRAIWSSPVGCWCPCRNIAHL